MILVNCGLPRRREKIVTPAILAATQQETGKETVTMKRKPIPQKLRFEVFHRDAFTCQYCGRSVPDAVLEIDHITPVSKGGEDVIDNLITSCFDCNRGKAARVLSVATTSIEDKTKVLQERRKQLKAYNRAIEQKIEEDEALIDRLQHDVWEEKPQWILTTSQRHSIRKNFINKLDYLTLRDAIQAACWGRSDQEQAFKYFCGICWNKIKGRVAY